MFNFNYITEEDIKEHNPNWPEIPCHPYRILISGVSTSGKTFLKLLLNTQVIRVMFTKILKNTIQMKNEKY